MEDGNWKRGDIRAALCQTGGGARPKFCHGLQLDSDCLLRPQRREAGGGVCTQGLRTAGEGKRTGAVLHRGRLLPYRDWRAGEGGADLRTVAAYVLKRLYSIQRAGKSFRHGGKLGKGIG